MLFNISIFILLLNVLAEKVILISRHGQRSPTKYKEGDAEKWFPAMPGDLTPTGVRFLLEKGASLSKDFNIYDSDGNCDLSKMEIISSLKQRTILSTFSYLKAFCPKNYMEILQQYVEQYMKPYASVSTDYITLVNNNFEDIFSLSNYTRSFKYEKDVMFHPADICDPLNEIRDQIEQTRFYKEMENYYKSHPLFQEVLEVLKQKMYLEFKKNPTQFTPEGISLNKFKTVLGDYKCEWAQNLDIPPFSEEQYKLLSEVAAFVFYDVKMGHDDIKKVQLTEMFKWIKRALLTNDKEFYWYSGHDTNQVALLSTIMTKQQRDSIGYLRLPPFGADIQIRLEYQVVNIYLNQHKLHTRFCDQQTSCSVQDVIKFLETYMIDLEKYCSNL